MAAYSASSRAETKAPMKVDSTAEWWAASLADYSVESRAESKVESKAVSTAASWVATTAENWAVHWADCSAASMA